MGTRGTPAPPLYLDTNSIIYSIKNRVDIRSIITGKSGIGKVQIPQCVIDELEGLSVRLPDARAGLMLASRFDHIPSTGKGDQCIIDLAVANGAIVLTNDRELIGLLRKKGVRVMSIRGGNSIDFV